MLGRVNSLTQLPSYFSLAGFIVIVRGRVCPLDWCVCLWAGVQEVQELNDIKVRDCLSVWLAAIEWVGEKGLLSVSVVFSSPSFGFTPPPEPGDPLDDVKADLTFPLTSPSALTKLKTISERRDGLLNSSVSLLGRERERLSRASWSVV